MPTALEKVLSLSAAPAADEESEAARFVRAAGAELEQLKHLLLAGSDADEDDDGEGGDWDEDDDDQDEDDSPAAKKKKAKKAASKKKQVVQASILSSMVALSQLEGGEEISLAVLDAAARRKAAKAGYTIAGSEDYPIPDAVHLAAAVARYKQGKLAGHSKSAVAAHIRKHARRLNKQVDLGDGGDERVAASAVLALARGGNPTALGMGMAPLEHGPTTGVHSHPHRTSRVVDGEHYHNDDNRHGGRGGDW